MENSAIIVSINDTDLDVEMYDAVFVHISESVTDLSHVVDNFGLRHLVILRSYSVE